MVNKSRLFHLLNALLTYTFYFSKLINIFSIVNFKFTAGLGEFRIRDLNDEINKLMREKRHWEVQIKTLGGPDHARVGPKMLDQDGKEVPGNRGYKYFGAAKDLPGKIFSF